MTPRKAMRAGLALLPANRLRHSGVGQATVAENMTLAIVGSFYRRGVLRLGREARAVDKLMRIFRVQPQAPQQPLAALSGGNQQKSLLAKWFARAPRVLLLEEPTNGVDVGAKKQIFQQIRDAAEADGGILIASVESADLAQLCDRVLVFRDGRVVSRLHGSELNEARIIEQALMSQG
jgi:ribose transport system ATP-binding protein